MDCREKPYCTFALTVLSASWILVALFIGEMELLRLVPALAIPAMVWSLTGGLLLLYWKNQPFRAFVDDLGLRALLAIHLTRFVGIYFLHLSSEGRLPSHIAIPAGWGDILAAAGALALLFKPEPRFISKWNWLAFADILFVVFTVAREVIRRRSSVDEFCFLPLSFLPTLVVPLILFSHVILFLRLRRRAPIPVAQNATQMALPI
jgi:hypothetical protein